jgi:probable F420-dependent oxidoreductase
MKFAYHHSMCPTEQYLPLTIEAEKLGFDTITMPDSICYPKEGSSKYPYNSDGSREFLDGVPFIEPFLLTAHLAALTSKIRFTTSVHKLAVHEPALIAKSLSSLAILTGNRFGYGVGISPWAEDFEVTNVPWDKRGKRMDEMIEIINGLMTGEYFGYKGEIFDMPEIKICPVPTVRPPILVGGHSTPALRRAARLGDGWIAAGGELDSIKTMVDKINEFRKEYGRDHLPFKFHAMTAEAYSADGIKRLEDIGIDEVLVAFRDVYASEADDKTVEEKIGMMSWYANEVIAKSKQ